MSKKMVQLTGARARRAWRALKRAVPLTEADLRNLGEGEEDEVELLGSTSDLDGGRHVLAVWRQEIADADPQHTLPDRLDLADETIARTILSILQAEDLAEAEAEARRLSLLSAIREAMS
jgi:hypothetical protein